MVGQADIDEEENATSTCRNIEQARRYILCFCIASIEEKKGLSREIVIKEGPDLTFGQIAGQARPKRVVEEQDHGRESLDIELGRIDLAGGCVHFDNGQLGSVGGRNFLQSIFDAVAGVTVPGHEFHQHVLRGTEHC